MPKSKETPQRPVQTSAGDLCFVEGRFWNSLDTWHNLEMPPSENNHNFKNREELDLAFIFLAGRDIKP